MLKELYKEFLKSGELRSEVKTYQHEDGAIYARNKLHKIKSSIDHEPEVLNVGSLVSVCDYIAQGIDEGPLDVLKDHLFIQIDGPRVVTLRGRIQTDNENTRFLYLKASIEQLRSFQFDAWYDLESFVIAVQSLFKPNEELEQVIGWIGALANEKVLTNNDDGFSQSIQIKTGITSKSNVKIENPITLMPYRTFREVDQPPGQFILRLKESSSGNSLKASLIEADGGAWTIQASVNIKKWFEDQNLGIPILA